MSNRTFKNWLRTLGAPEDPVATNTSAEWSAMSLLKAVYGQLAGGGLQLGLVAAMTATSGSSVAIGTGPKLFTVEAAKAFQPGMWLNIASDADETNFMNGIVTGYSGTTLNMLIDNVGGTGTFADWIISLSGSQGQTSTLTIGTVTTVAAGQPATVTDVGTPGSPILDFEIPEGQAGAVAVNGTPTVNNLASWHDATTIKDAGVALSTDGTFAADSDAKVPTEKAVKTYADGLITALRNGVSAAFDTLAEVATDLGLKMVKSANLSDVANAATAFGNIKQAATTSATGVTELAVAAEYRSSAAGNLALTPAEVYSAMAEVTLTDAATIAWDMDTGFDFVVTLGGSRTLGQPTNQRVGKKGRLRVMQDATGSRTLSFHGDFEFAGSSAVVLSTAGNAQDVLYYDVIAANRILITGAVKAIG